MSTVETDKPIVLPWLVDGERLDRATFHDRYAAMPESTRAELIGGIVHMGSPLGLRHSSSSGPANFWLLYYAELTPGVQSLENASILLENFGEPQPDSALRILPEHGGRTRDQGNFCAGGPELIVEVSDATLAKDLGPKLADYERAGVPEYVVVSVKPRAVRWHVLRDGKLVEVGPDPDGIYRSTVFSGLWLDPSALLKGDTRALRATVDRGVATPEHAAFVDRLAKANAGGAGGA